MYLSPVNRKELGYGCEPPHDVGGSLSHEGRWLQVCTFVCLLLLFLFSTGQSNAAQLGYTSPAQKSDALDFHGRAAAQLPTNVSGLLPSRADLEYAGEQAAIGSQELSALSNRLDNTYTAVRTIEIGGTIITSATGIGGGIKLLATEGLKQGGKILGKQLAKGALAAGAAEGAYHLGQSLGLTEQEATWARAGVYVLANAIGGAKALKDARAVSKGFNGKGCSAPNKTVGRWMSPDEAAKMKKTGKVQEGGGGQTRVADPSNPTAYRNPPKGDKYVEFDVPANRVKPHSNGTGRIPGPNSPDARVPGRNPADHSRKAKDVTNTERTT